MACLVFVLLFAASSSTAVAASLLVETDGSLAASDLAADVGRVTGEIELLHVFEVAVADVDLGPLAARYASLSGVVSVRPEGEFEVLEGPSTPEQPLWPDDPWVLEQQWLQMIAAPEAWGLGLPVVSSPVVAVIDTGLDVVSPEFTGRVVSPADLSEDVVTADVSESNPERPHGTWVSSILLAQGDNGFAGAGVAWDARVMPIKVSEDGDIGEAEAAAGIAYAIEHGADIISMSWGGPGADYGVARAAIEAASARGIVLVAAAGNTYPSEPDVLYPASDPRVIAVGSVDDRFERAPYSCVGPEVELVAPGGAGPDPLLTMGVDGKKGWVQGTSFSAPMVSGAAALLLSRVPSLSPSEVRGILAGAARDLGATGRDPFYGYGLLNTEKALEQATDAGPVFSDVPVGSTYRVAIEALAKAGIVVGYADGTFRPSDPVLRQQFAKMIVLTEGLHTEAVDNLGRQTFRDLGYSGNPYPYDYVEEAAAAGIIAGYADGTFRPYRNVSRAQLITMVARAAALPSPPAGFTTEFGNFSPAHYPSARKADYAGLLDGLEGIGAGYDFWRSASRGEVAALLYALLLSS